MTITYLKRDAEERLKDILAEDKVGLILGARQVGKTTLVERVLAGQGVVFLNFEALYGFQVGGLSDHHLPSSQPNEDFVTHGFGYTIRFGRQQRVVVDGHFSPPTRNAY